MSHLSNNDSNAVPTAADAPPANDESLARRLLPEFLQKHSALLAIFALPNLEARYLNEAARKRLVPSSALTDGEIGFGLMDIVAIADIERFKARILPMAQIAGSWTGRLDLRDLWGSEFASLSFLSCKTASSREKFAVLQATMIEESFCSDGSGGSDSDFLAALLNSSADMIYFKDRLSRFLKGSVSLATRFGAAHARDIIGRTDFDYYDVEHAGASYEDEQKIISSGVPIVDKVEKEVWPSGEVTYVSTTKMPLKDREGETIGTFGISRNITERIREEERRRVLESELQLTHKLESIGSLAAGIAHEINTPTQFVSDNLVFLTNSFEHIDSLFEAYQLLKDHVRAVDADCVLLTRVEALEDEIELDFLRSEIVETLEQSTAGMQTVGRIVSSLKEFSHPGSVQKAPSNLNRAVQTTVNVAKHEWKYLADLQLRLDPELPEIFCVIDEINQVVLNLIVNAAHAIGALPDRKPGGKGRIIIETQWDGAWAVLRVSDTGTGIPEAARPHVFDPFFTTKEAGRGTGQGLAIVQNVVVKNHGGLVDFDTEIGRGTVFTVKLPIRASSPGKRDGQD